MADEQEQIDIRDEVEELKQAAAEKEAEGNQGEDAFVPIAAEYLRKYQPDVFESIMRGASKVGDIEQLSLSSVPGAGKALIAAIGGAGKGFSEAMNDKEKRNAILAAEMARFKPKFSDPYAERRDKEMKIKILDKVNAKASDYEKSETFKNMNEAVTSYNQLVSLTNDAASSGFADIAILTKFMKALDPRSVVRDTEFQTAANTGSLFQSLQNKLAGLITGRKITDKQRQEIVQAATAVMEANKENFGNFRQKQIDRAKQPLQYYKSIFPELDTEADKIFIDLGEGVSAAKDTTKTQVPTYKTPQGEKSEDEMREIFFNAPQNKGQSEDAFKSWLTMYGR